MKPMLAINFDDINKISFPKYASTKLDGIRCIFHPELGMVSRSLKQIQNKQLQEKFKHILAYCKENNIILDGELYSHKLTFQEITRGVMTQDFKEDKNKIKKELNINDDEYIGYQEYLISNIDFFCFDIVNDSLFVDRYEELQKIKLNHMKILEQKYMTNPQQVKKYFDKVLDEGYEGLILKKLDGKYKFGRSTQNEELLLKIKPYETFDSKILEIIQATEVDELVEKKTNELGYSVTSRKKDDRKLIDKASAFRVRYFDCSLKVSLTMTDKEKEEVWKNRENYIGKTIEYKALKIGMKDVPRHPVFVRYREDKDE